MSSVLESAVQHAKNGQAGDLVSALSIAPRTKWVELETVGRRFWSSTSSSGAAASKETESNTKLLQHVVVFVGIGTSSL